MDIMKFALVAGLATIFTAPLNAAESVVNIQVDDQQIVGTLNVPDGVSSPSVVLLLPGFGSVRDELMVTGTEKGVFAHLANHLAVGQVASLRIDYRGSGDSDGTWEDTSFSSQIADGLAAIKWLTTNEQVDGANIAIVGWSQGGLIASHVAAAHPEAKSLSLWAPVVHPRSTFAGLLGESTIATALAGPADEAHTTTLPWGVDTTLKGQFYHELVTTSTAGAVAAYQGPLLVIVGVKDDVVSPQPGSGQLLLYYHNGQEKLAVFETGHVWGAFEGPDMLETNVFPTTIEWIKAGF